MSRRGTGVSDTNGYPGLYVANASNNDPCEHVATAVGYLGANYLNFVELGWVIADNGTACTPASSDPYVGVSWTLDQTPYCRSGMPSLQNWEGKNKKFWMARDENHPTVWFFYTKDAQGNTNAYWSQNTKISGYVPSVNAERYDADGSMFANFNGTDAKTSTGWHVWSDFTSPECGPTDDDPDYDADLRAQNDPLVKVLNACTT